MDFFMYELLPALLNMNLTASLIILVVLAARLLLKRAPRAFSYALWAVVLFRLLCPVSFASDVSFLDAVDAPAEFAPSGQISVISYVPTDIVHYPEPSVQLPVPALNEAINPNLPQGAEQTVADPLEAPVSMLTFLWTLVAAFLLLRGLVLYLDLRMRLWRSPKLSGRVYAAKGIGTAFVAGILRPKIYLPEGLGERESECVLAHERSHIRRGDHIIKPLAYMALCLHWFNPLVWLAWVLAMRDMESSCDEAAIKRLGASSRADYAQALLNLATGRRVGFNAALAFGNDTKRRIKEVAKLKPAKKWASVLAALLAVVIIAGCAANPAGAAESGGGKGEYADINEYVESLVGETVMYRNADGGMAEGYVLDSEVYILRAAQLTGLVPDAKLESFCYSIYYQLDVEPDELVHEDGQWSLDDGWYCFDPNRHAYALSYADGSCDVLNDTKYEYDGSTTDAARLYDWYVNDYGGTPPDDVSQIAGLGARGEYAGLDEYFNAQGSEDSIRYETVYGGTAEANVLAKSVYREKRGEISGLDADGTLEAWVYVPYYQLDTEPQHISLASGSMSHEGWCNFDGGNLLFALRCQDGSCSVLRDEPLNDSILTYPLAVDALWDWYVTENNIALPLTTLDWGEELGNGTCTASLICGDGWYAYCPSSGWLWQTTAGGRELSCSSALASGESFSVEREDNALEASDKVVEYGRLSTRTRVVPDGNSAYTVTGTWNTADAQEAALVNRMVDTFGVGEAYAHATPAVGLSAYGGLSASTISSELRGDGWRMIAYGSKLWNHTDDGGLPRLEAKSGSGAYLELRPADGAAGYTGIVNDSGIYSMSRTVTVGGQLLELRAAWPEEVNSTEGIALLGSFDSFSVS